MKRHFVVWCASVAMIASVQMASGRATVAQGQGNAYGRPEVQPAVRHDTSRPLREIPARPPVSTRGDFDVKRPVEPGQAVADASVQSFAVAALAATTGLSFNGVGRGADFSFTVNYAPPDTVGEAGLTQYVQWVNASFAVFDKATGALLYGPAGGNTLWAGFGGDCEARNDGDPIVQYDQLADRWVMTQFAVRSGNYLQCVAVSQSADATGAWHRYAFSYSQFPDYPKLAVWPDAYYVSFNMFQSGISFAGARLCAYDRARMLQGLSATQQCFQIGNASLLPSDLEGKTLPPAGTPNYFMNRASGSLNLWKFHVDFATPANTTLSGAINIPVSAYSPACGGGTCIPQAGTSNLLDSLGDRLMYRLSYRNFGGGHEALVVNHSVAANGVTGIRWYEIDIQNGTPSIHQQSTYAPADGLYRWMGSAATDASGNLAVGYSVSSAATSPSIRFAGRESGDAPGVLSNETDMMTGAGSQTGSLHRWGDYSTLSIDPVDDCTFWYTTEYLQTSGSFNWSTRVGSFKFASCTGGGGGGSPDFTVAVTPASRTITQGQSTTYDVTVGALNGYSGSGTFSVTGLPGSIGASFSPPGYAGGSGSSTLTITTTETSATGTFPLTIQASDGTLTHGIPVTLVVNSVVPPDFTMSFSPGSRNVKAGQSTTYTVTIGSISGFNDWVDLSVSGGDPTMTFSPLSVPVGSRAWGVQTTAATPKRTYTLTITGTAAGVAGSKTATVNLRVR